jgi:hypothetical protein
LSKAGPVKNGGTVSTSDDVDIVVIDGCWPLPPRGHYGVVSLHEIPPVIAEARFRGPFADDASDSRGRLVGA